MYEAPTLIEVGKAEDVILGLLSIGHDCDDTLFIGAFEFLDDEPSIL